MLGKQLEENSKLFFLQLFLVQWTQFAYCTAASNKLQENKSNFFPALYPSIKIKIVNETHIEIQSQWQL